MQQPPSDFDISSFEDLSPEPPPRGRLWQARELALGLVLLLCVLAWGGWQSWQQAAQESSYRLGAEATAHKDWEAARTLFAAAGGYRDAPLRAAEASREIAERDSDYASAVGHLRAGEWAAALRDAGAAAEIQPSYRDLGRVASEASTQIYRETLSGTVALRTEAHPPGLYYRNANGWIWLQGSDAASRVRGAGVADYFVYDAPGGVAQAGPVPTPVPYTGVEIAGSPQLAGRRLLAASFSSAPAFFALSLDPAHFNTYYWGTQGVWGLRYSDLPATREASGGRHSLAGVDIVYERFGSTQTQILKLPRSDPNWFVLDLGLTGRTILMAHSGGEGSSDSRLALYLAGPDGTEPRSLGALGGGLESAALSPDGEHAFAITYVPTTDFRRELQSVYLLDARGSSPRKLLEGPTEASARAFFPAVGATFLARGPLAGDILAARWEGVLNHFLLVDPRHPDHPLLDTQFTSSKGPVGPTSAVELLGEPAVLVAGQNGLGGVLPFADSLTIAKLAPGKEPTAATIPVGTGEFLLGTWVREPYILFGALASGRAGEPGGAFLVRSAKLLSLQGGEASSTLSYEGRWSQMPQSPLTLDVALGAGMLAYSDRGELRARTYDGAIDVLLEKGVGSLYFFPYAGVHSLR